MAGSVQVNERPKPGYTVGSLATGNDYAQLLNEETEAWNQFVGDAAGKKGWFAKSIHFNVNGMELSGYTGSRVTAGTLSLFDGAYLDLRKSRLKGVSRNEASGEGGILILTPKNADGGNAFRIRSLNIKEQGGITAEVEGDFYFRESSPLRGRTVRGRGMKLSENKIMLGRAIEGTLQGADTQLLEGAIVDERGITPETSDVTMRMTQVEKERLRQEAEKKRQRENEQEKQRENEREKQRENEREKQRKKQRERMEATKRLEAPIPQKEEESYLKTSASGAGMEIGKDHIKLSFGAEAEDGEGLEGANTIETILGEMDWEKCIKNVSKYLETGEAPEKKEKPWEFPLFEIPLLPGLSFGVTAKFHGAFHIGTSVDFYRNMEDPDNPGQRKFQGAGITFEASMEGELSAGLEAALQAGLPGLFSLDAGVEAVGKVGGTILDLTAELQFDNQFHLKSPLVFKASNQDGIGLSGEVKGAFTVKSPLLAWEKTLYEYTFIDWKMDHPVLKIPEFELSKDLSQPINRGWNLKTSGMAKKLHTYFGDYPKEEALGIHHDKKEKYNAVMNESDDMINAYTAACETLVELKKYKGIYIPPGSEGFNEFLQRLENIEKQFKELDIGAYISMLKQDEIYGELLANPDFMKAVETYAKGERKHRNRIAAMEAWAEKADSTAEEDEKYKNMDVMEAYGEAKGGKGLKTTLMQAAQEQIYTVPNIIAYEEARIKEIGEEHLKRIVALEQNQDSGEKSSRIKDSMSQMLTTQQLIEYEDKQKEEIRKPYDELLALLQTKVDALTPKQQNTPDKNVLSLYEEKAKEKGILQKDYQYYSGLDELEAYEAGQIQGGFGILERSKKRTASHLMAADALQSQGLSDADALAKFLNAEDIGESERAKVSQSRKNIQAEAAKSENALKLYTITDLLEYENTHSPAQLGILDNEMAAMHSQKRLSKEMLDEDQQKAMKKRQANVFDRMKKQQMDVRDGLAEILSLEDIVEYEMSRIEHYAHEKGEKKEEGQEKHKKRLELLQAHVAVRDHAGEPGSKDWQKAQAELVGHYLKSSKSGAGLVEQLQEGDLQLASIAMADISNEKQGVEEFREKRIQMLLQAEADAVPMPRVQTAYERLGGQFFKIKKEELAAASNTSSPANISFAALSAYMEHKLGDVKHLERLRYIKKWKSESLSDEEILKRYREQELINGTAMAGEKGFFSSQSDGGNMTPQKILKMVQDQKANAVSGHEELLSLLRAWQQEETDGSINAQAVNLRYQKAAQERGLLKAVNKSLKEENNKGRMLTAGQRLIYEKNRLYEITEKHQERLAWLRGDGEDKAKIERYFKEEGAGGFITAQDARVKEEYEKSLIEFALAEPKSKTPPARPDIPQTSAERKASPKYQMLLRHEQSRVDYYAAGQGNGQGIIENLAHRQIVLAEQKEEGEKILDAIKRARQAAQSADPNPAVMIGAFEELLGPIEERLKGLKEQSN